MPLEIEVVAETEMEGATVAMFDPTEVIEIILVELLESTLAKEEGEALVMLVEETEATIAEVLVMLAEEAEIMVAGITVILVDVEEIIDATGMFHTAGFNLLVEDLKNPTYITWECQEDTLLKEDGSVIYSI